MSIGIISQPTDQGPEPLHNFVETIVHSISITGGNWLIFGKILVSNSDSDDQNVNVRLRVHAQKVLDRADFRMPGGGIGQPVSLEAAMTGPDAAPTRLDITCATFNGQAYEAQLIAISVDRLENVTVPL